MKTTMIILFITFFSITILLADGVQPAGAGTEASPYQIATLNNLLWVSTNLTSWDKYYVQIADINAATTNTWNGGGFCGYSVNADIYLSYSIGSVEWTGNDPTDKGFLGGAVGILNSFISNFFDSEHSNQQTDAENAATGKTTLEMKTQSTFTDEWWDFVGESDNGDDDY